MELGLSPSLGNNTHFCSGLVWQLMRENVIQILKTLSRDGKEVTEHDMITWANSTVKRVGKTSSMSGFKDSKLRSGAFFLDLLSGIKKGIVDFALVTDGVSDDDAKMNAKYAISIARKLGATIFLLPGLFGARGSTSLIPSTSLMLHYEHTPPPLLLQQQQRTLWK